MATDTPKHTRTAYGEHRGPYLRAAPSLYEALKTAVALFEMDPECNTPGADAYVWLQEARAAIRLAEGA